MSLAALAVFSSLVGCPKVSPEPELPPRAEPLAERQDLVETLHGVEIADPYRWLEDSDSDQVRAFTEARRAEFVAATDALPLRAELYERVQRLTRYDDQSARSPCLIGNRSVFYTRRADQDKWVVHLAEGPDDPGRVVLDPNTWGETDTLGEFSPDPSCRRAVVGRARAGNEDPVLTVLDLDTLETGPDTFRGWKQGGATWAHDGSGLWYTSKPTAEERPDGGHFYYHRVWWHALGTTAERDVLTLADDEVREHYHWVSVSEDGRWQLRYQGLFNTNRLWLLDLADPDAEPVPVATDMDAQYLGTVLGDKLVIVTDKDAPHKRVMVTSVDHPEPEHWTELIPEQRDTLGWADAIGGRLYAVYQHDVATRIDVYDPDGTRLGEVPLPTLGSASVSGWFTRPEVQVSFASFGHPDTVYAFDPEKIDADDGSALSVLAAPAIPIERELLDRIVVEQAWFHSRDDTEVPMFVVHTDDAAGPVPLLLTGYGGFDISMEPKFSLTYALWLERGGAVAIPNLRGGGEFGREWHEAGMRERKQNVFDDFVAAAEWLVAEGWTTPEQLAISGGSNGGLLVAAAVTQRPDLFGAVLCSVPLTDMVRYHKFGLANIWAEEYGSAEDPEQLPYLLAYSPYHAVREGADYPAVLVVGSTNDARTDPAHARKFFAALQWADVDRGANQPILLNVQGESGHHGGVTIDTRADQTSRNHAFLMRAVGLGEGAGAQPP